MGDKITKKDLINGIVHLLTKLEDPGMALSRAIKMGVAQSGKSYGPYIWDPHLTKEEFREFLFMLLAYLEEEKDV